MTANGTLGKAKTRRKVPTLADALEVRLGYNSTGNNVAMQTYYSGISSTLLGKYGSPRRSPFF